MAEDRFFRAVLANTLVCSVEYECLLTGLRAALLSFIGDIDANRERKNVVLGIACLLAHQCFSNEYVFSFEPDEAAQLERVKGEINSALANGDPVDPLLLAALAMYEPLNRLPQMASLAAHKWPEPLATLVLQQIVEPMRERQLRDTIPRLTPLGGGVTADVRTQYEENPYPRWVHVGPAPKQFTLDEYLRHHFTTSFRPLGDVDPLEILVAGCGTGRHVIELAQTYHHARVLGVDLSLASLAHAKRMIPPPLATSIEFAQADIMAIGAIGRSFDFINVGGVLHHLEDPLAGWRELLKLLRPNGLMQVGLYSELARADVVAARALIAERGYRATIEDIRRCRQDILNTPMRALLTNFNDFFTLSGCRDLMFHVQEHRLTIPKIKEFFAANDLKFIGFDFSPPEAHAFYRSEFADRGWSTTDLDRWHAYETENPRTFTGMYHFWLQKN